TIQKVFMVLPKDNKGDTEDSQYTLPAGTCNIHTAPAEKETQESTTEPEEKKNEVVDPEENDDENNENNKDNENTPPEQGVELPDQELE
ncbi:MAG TPA: hypothetical protein IAC41_02485, partial [Candidatus Merdenecus merdavium]|nr:hypothetical protein [Candidatus Merdenecus merdavium]